MWVPLGSMFSFIEVLPLVLLIIEAIQQYELIRAHGASFPWILGRQPAWFATTTAPLDRSSCLG